MEEAGKPNYSPQRHREHRETQWLSGVAAIFRRIEFRHSVIYLSVPVFHCRPNKVFGTIRDCSLSMVNCQFPYGSCGLTAALARAPRMVMVPGVRGGVCWEGLLEGWLRPALTRGGISAAVGGGTGSVFNSAKAAAASAGVW